MKQSLCRGEPTKSLGTVIVVHGYMDHTGLYGHLIRHLLDRQLLTVVCLDLKGHGLSSGAACSITNFGDYVAQVKSVIALCQMHFEGPLHGIGQSMGGAVLMKHCLNQSAHNAYPFASPSPCWRLCCNRRTGKKTAGCTIFHAGL